MRILHLCSYYNTSKLYENFFSEISKYGISQYVYIPMYKKQAIIKEYGTVRGESKDSKYTKYNYSKILPKPLRYMLHARVHYTYKHLLKENHIDEFNISHAHSLLYNGGIALNLKKHYKIPYIVAVRSTDIEVLQKLPFYSTFAKEILASSEKIIFISKVLQKSMMSLKAWDSSFADKSIVLTNGINDDWYDKKKSHKDFNLNDIQFLYQGTLLERKKVDYSIRLVENLNDSGVSCRLRIIGSGPMKSSVLNMISSSKYHAQFNYTEWINSKAELKNNYYNADIFIMPSVNETFGIAYIESLACGTPVIYRKNEGIDGVINHNQGVSITGEDINEDTLIILDMIRNFQQFQKNCKSKTFRWSDICKKYISIYKTYALK